MVSPASQTPLRDVQAPAVALGGPGSFAAFLALGDMSHHLLATSTASIDLAVNPPPAAASPPRLLYSASAISLLTNISDADLAAAHPEKAVGADSPAHLEINLGPDTVLSKDSNDGSSRKRKAEFVGDTPECHGKNARVQRVALAANDQPLHPDAPAQSDADRPPSPIDAPSKPAETAPAPASDAPTVMFSSEAYMANLKRIARKNAAMQSQLSMRRAMQQAATASPFGAPHCDSSSGTGSADGTLASELGTTGASTSTSQASAPAVVSAPIKHLLGNFTQTATQSARAVMGFATICRETSGPVALPPQTVSTAATAAPPPATGANPSTTGAFSWPPELTGSDARPMDPAVAARPAMLVAEFPVRVAAQILMSAGLPPRIDASTTQGKLALAIFRTNVLHKQMHATALYLQTARQMLARRQHEQMQQWYMGQGLLWRSMLEKHEAQLGPADPPPSTKALPPRSLTPGTLLEIANRAAAATSSAAALSSTSRADGVSLGSTGENSQ